MKFDEKLIILRKKALLSQEALAEKLNVTRQTISKWELGQTKPDMEKLKEMSKLFNVDINVLTDDTISLEENKSINKESNKNDKRPKKIILYIVILIFIASLTTLVYRIGYDIKLKTDSAKEAVEKRQKAAEERQKAIEDEINKQMEQAKQEEKETKAKMELSRFNSQFEFYQGTETSTPTSNQIDTVIKNNKTNQEHLVEVVFDGTSYGTDPEKIKEIKNSLKNFKGYEIQYYEISIDYDDNGYVNKITIETR